ncbi:MAG: SDR family oxidoreductase [Gammaproteobacteria bacterium]|nr:MAG: SDR family oxidoreductase [Gammaproteobacteria bacterium]
MDRKRRRILQAGLLGGAAAASSGLPLALAAEPLQQANRAALNILVLGGTGFIGPHMVSEALRRGHSVTLFNRGRSNRKLFPDLQLLLGDRDAGLQALAGREWDAVIDNSGYVPRHVRDSAALLAPAVSHYLFVSTISVYASYAQPNDETSPLATMPDESVEEVTPDTYGPMKALCEKQAAAEIAADRLTILRPTYICGPGDRTDRYTYWPVRTMRGGEMLWPGAPQHKIQIVDVRDLANFVIDCLEQKIAGIYNTVTPAGSFSMGQLLQDCAAVTAADMMPRWVDDAFIRRHAVAAAGGLPLWSPARGDTASVAWINGERAVAQGLHNRPTRETARDTLRWWQTLPAERRGRLQAGLSAEKEQQLLAL